MGLLKNLAAKMTKPVEQNFSIASEAISFDSEKLRGETIVNQKIHKLIRESMTNDYFDIESVAIITGIIQRLDYALIDQATNDLYTALNYVLQRNYDFKYGECKESETYDEDMKAARRACLKFTQTIEQRTPNPNANPFTGKGFTVIGTFNFGTHAQVIELIESLGCTKVENNYSENYADYTFVGCKPNKRHPSKDFSDVVDAICSETDEWDGFYRLAIAEYDFDPLCK